MGNCLQCGGILNLNINLDEELRHILCPARDALLLQEEMDALRSTQEDVEQEIRVLEGNPCKRVLQEVHSWITSVKEHDSKVKEILSSLNHNINHNYSPSSSSRFTDSEKTKESGSSSSRFRGLCCCFCLNHSLGVEVKNELQVVRLLNSRRDNWGDKLSVDVPLQCNRRLSERLGDSNVGSIVGVEETMSRVLQYLKEDRIGVVGIHGMGGVGKTTLVNHVISRLPSSSPEEEPIMKFGSIISVAVSQNLDVRRIQDEIAKQLGLSGSELSRNGNDERDRAGLLSAWLSRRKFLLVLDDVWEAVDLKRIGIPTELLRRGGKFSSGCGSKVVLTTRDENVCVDMGCQRRVKVGCLGMEHSRELFRQAIQWEWEDDDDWLESVRGIAEEIVRRCGGLPLVLITVARAMATKRTITEWRDAEEALKDSPHEIRGMEDVFRLLKFSYDNLEDDEHRSCLLYSALFPEDYKIPIEKMVDYCIGAGSAYSNTIGDDGSSSSSRSFDIELLRRKGRNTISGLIDAYLLERWEDVHGKPRVKVHDAIRDMILWLGEGEKAPHGSRRTRHKILSLAGKGLRGVVKIDEILWRDASMVSLRNNDIQEVVVGHENLVQGCNSNVRVLLLTLNRHLENLPGSLFEYFPGLRALDLACTNLRDIPTSLCLLKSLQYLNLSHTDIEALPKEMGNLTNLLQLKLTFTSYLCEIPRGVFSSLSKLQSMDLFGCVFFTHFTHEDKEKAQVWKEVDDLQLCKDIRLSFDGNPDALKFLVDELDMFSESIINLRIFGGDLVSQGLFQRIGSKSKKLKHLAISNFLDEDKEEDLLIDEGHFTQLEDLTIRHTNSLQRIILKGPVLEQLTKLEIFDCNGLRDLACLWLLSNLKSLTINNCDGIVEVLPPQSGGDGNQSCGIYYRHDPLPKVECIILVSMRSLVRISSSPMLCSLTQMWIDDCPSLKELWVVQSNARDLTVYCMEKWWEGLEWENGAPPSNFIPDFGYKEGEDQEGGEEEEAAEES